MIRVAISVSAAGDINGDSVDDLVIGAYEYPSGSFKGRSYVVFGDAPPVLVNNSLSIGVGGMVTLTPSDLAAYDRNHNNQSLVFVPGALQGGYFAALSAPAKPLVNFTQAQIQNSSILFVRSGSAFICAQLQYDGAQFRHRLDGTLACQHNLLPSDSVGEESTHPQQR